MKKKDSNFDDLLYRLKAADPAKRAEPKIGEQVIMNAMKEKIKSKKWGFPQFATLSGVATASAAALIVGIGLPAAVTASPEPLLSLGAQGATNSEGSFAAGGSDSGMSQDRSMLWYQPYNYLYKPGALISQEPSKGNAYKFTLTGDGTAELESLKELFQLDGKTTIDPYSYDKNHFFIGDIDNYNTESLSLHWTNLGSWYYSNPVSNNNISVPCGIGLDERAVESPEKNSETGEDILEGAPKPEEAPITEAVPVEPCMEMAPPANLPTSGEAKDAAYKLFSAAGVVLKASDISVSADEWGVSASYALVVEGEKTNVSYNASWYGEEITYASGSFAKPVLVQEVDMISAYDAIERVSDYRWWGSYYQDVMDYAIAYSTSDKGSAISESPISESPISGSPSPVDANGGELSPEEWVEPAIETVEVVFDSSEQKLLMVWDANGDVWLLPGYVYKTTNDKYYGSAAVVAVEASLITLPKE